MLVVQRQRTGHRYDDLVMPCSSAGQTKRGGELDAAGIEFQLALGHASQTTTEQYVNAEQDMQLAPGDVLGICVEV